MCDYGLFKKSMLSSLPATLRGAAAAAGTAVPLSGPGRRTDLLRTRLQTLEDTVQIQRDLYQRQGLYWLRSQGVSLGPFCPQCQENGGGLIRLYPTGTALCCPYCHALYPRPGCQETPANSGALRHARILPFGR